MRFGLVATIVLSFLMISTAVLGEGESLDTFAYQSGVTIVNDSGSTLTNAPVAIPAQSANLIAQGYMQADAEDSRIATQAGSELRHVAQGMTSDDVAWWVRVPSLADGSSITHVFHTGNSSATLDQEFLLDGSGDTITATDHADLDLTTRLYAQAEFNVQSWPTSETYLLRKQGAYEISLDDPGGVETIYGRVYTSQTATLLPNATGDFENIANERGCASGSHWDCLQSNDGSTSQVREIDALPDNTLQDAVNVGDFTPTGVTILDVDIVCDIAGPAGAWQVGLRLSGTTGTLQDAAGGGGDCGGVSNFARPGGGSWTASDLDSVQLVVEITEFKDTATSVAFNYAAIVVTYADSTEASVTTDETGTALVIDTEYTVILTTDSGPGSVDLTVLRSASSEGAGPDGFDATDFTGTIYSSANNVVVGSGIDGIVDDVTVGTLGNETDNPSFEHSSSTNGWANVGGGQGLTIDVSTTETLLGDQTLRFFYASASGTGDHGRRQTVPVGAGETWSLSISYNVTSISGAQLRMRVYGTVCACNEWGVVAVSAPTAGWVTQTATITTNAGETGLVWDLILRSNNVGDSVTAYIDGATLTQGAGLTAWKNRVDVVNWDFEPDEVAQTQEGNSGNSWTWLGTVEDISTGGSDHDGTYSLTRNMSGITRYFNGLQIKALQDVVVAEDVRNTLSTSGIDPTNTQTAAQFPFRAEFEVGLDQLPITSEAAWFILVSALGFAMAIWAWSRSVNELLGTVPLVALYWMGWTLGLFGLYIVIIASIVCLAAAGGVRRWSQEA